MHRQVCVGTSAMHGNSLCWRLSDSRLLQEAVLWVLALSVGFSSNAEPQAAWNRAFYTLFTFWMEGYFRSLGSETKKQTNKSWGGKGGEGWGTAGCRWMWWSCTTLVNADQPTWLFRFSSLWLLGAPTITTLRKLHRQRACLTHIWNMLDKWLMTGKTKDIAPA